MNSTTAAAQADAIPVGLEEIRSAARRLGTTALRTPIIEAPHFSRLCGASVYLKLENLQRTGSFKLRGATNKIAALLEGGSRPRGVVAASAGNHAQGVASAASSREIPATVVMPQGATLSKIRACREMGAEVILTEPTLEGATQLARNIAEERGYAFLHPYDDWDVIAGQGTLGLELLEDLPDVDVVVCPLGGGGLTGGIALAIKLQRPNVRVVGVQTDAVCPYAGYIQSGIYQDVQPAASTIADGINVKRPGTRNSAVIRQYVDDVVTVDDNTISEAIVALLERTRTISEGAGAIGLAALMARKVRLRPQEKVAVVLSGGNIDMTLVGRIIDFGLVSSGRMMTVALTIQDAPGRLAHLLGVVAELGMNVRQIAHRRGELHIPVGQSEVVLQVETRDAEHQQELIRRFTAEGLPTRVLTG